MPNYEYRIFSKFENFTFSRIKIWNPPKSVIENTRLQEDGRPKLQFDVGGGPVVLKYSQRVDDGQYHQIQIIRNKEKGTIIVDDNDEEVVQGKCFLDLIQSSKDGSGPLENSRTVRLFLMKSS